MTILTWIVTVLFVITEHGFIKAQLFGPFLFSQKPSASCTNHFIGVDVITCGSLTQENLGIKAISDGFQMAEIPTEDCYNHINEFNLIQFKNTILIFTPGNESELETLAAQRRLFAINPVISNATLLLIVIWPNIMASKREENAFEKSLESLAHNFLLDEYIFLLFQTLLPDGSLKAKIVELYSIKNITFVQNVPYLKNENELDCNIFAATSLRRNNFKGAVITATAVESEVDAPVVTYGQSENVEFIGGLGVFDLWDIRDLLNFSIRAIKGSQDVAIENYTVVGIGRQLVEEDADISILHSYTLLPFLYHLTPLLPLGADTVYAFFLQPPSSSVRNIFHEPFQTDLWISLLIAWLLIIFCVFVIGLLERQMINYDDDEGMLWPLEETNLWAVSVIGQRSFYTNPNTMAMRIVFLTGLYMSMITFTSYSAAIISALTQETLPIKSLEDLVNNNFIEISDPSMFYSMFLNEKAASENYYTEENGNNYIDDISATKRITSGGSMFLTTFDTLCLSAREFNYTDNKICNDFSKVPLGKVVLTSGFYVKKRCPFKEAFNSKLLIMMERGLNKRYIGNYYLATLVKCTKKTTSYRENLGLNDVFTAFLTLCIGFGISLVLLVIEKFFAKFRNPLYQP